MAREQGPTDAADMLLQLGEKLRANAKRPNIYGYVPHAKQLKFHESQKRRRLYIGGNRSGKTTGGIIEDIWWALGEHKFRSTPEPPIRGRITSVSFTDGIEAVIIPELSRWIPIGRLKGGSWYTAYDKSERVLTFANGSFIELRSYDQDVEKFAGTSRHFIHMDEEPPKDIYNECMARLVDTGGSAWLTMTPLDGMTWVFDDLYEPAIAGDNPLIDVITVEMGENPHLNEGEVDLYLGSLDENERKARGKGEFVQMGGLVYKMFSDEIHVIDEFEVPKDWLWVGSMDHGLNSPTAWLHQAVDREGTAFTVWEHYKRNMMVNEHAQIVLKHFGELGRSPDYYVGDPSIRNRNPITGTSIHQEYTSFGVPIILGNNDVQAGLQKVSRYLTPFPTLDGTKRPRLYVTRNCTETIKEYHRYRWKTYISKKVEANRSAPDTPNQKDDHAMDSTRYFIMSQPDLVADQPASSEQVRNLLGLPGTVDPRDDKGPLADPNEGYGEWSEVSGTGNWDQVDEHMGGYF